jgi:uncharacterized membrane protein YdjX (TVP38/TMEM64 family)
MAATEPRAPAPRRAAEPSGSAAGARPRRWVQLSIVVALVLFGLGIIFAVPWLRHSFLLCLHGNFAGLRTYVRSLGAGGLALLVGLMIMHSLVYYPTELVTATAGFIYGWPVGLAVALGGWLLSALASYALGRLFAGPLLRALLGRRYTDFERAIQRGGTGLLLGYRLLPVVPFSFMGYAAGAVGTDVWTFSWTSVVGFVPLTVAVTYLGSRAESLSLGDPLVWAAVAVLLGLLVAAHRVQRRGRG